MLYQRNGIRIVYCLVTVGLVVSLWWGLAALSGWGKKRAATQLNEKLELAGALRAGSPQFDLYREHIAIAPPHVEVAAVADDLNVELIATVRNKTGRIIKGLEVRGIVADPQGRVSTQVAVIIPTQQTVMEPNEAINARLLFPGVRLETSPANMRVEVTGVLFDCPDGRDCS